ncbi:unnamed protein product, partial [marine sediment metagenome]
MVSNLEKQYSCERIIFAVPKKNLFQIDGLKNLHPLFESVRPLTLNRIYAKFKDLNWFGDSNIHSDLPIQQINIVNKKRGIIMISYSTNGNAFDFLNAEMHSDKEYNLLWGEISGYLMRILKRKRIPDPIWIKQNYWCHGTHHWNPNYDSDIVRKLMLKPIEEKNIHFIGSAYSRVQGWTDGAIESAKDLFLFLVGNGKMRRDNKYFSIAEISKHNKRGDGWIVLFKNVYDIT